MAKAQVSVIIPVYNGEKYVGEAIESVLAQSYGDLQVLVVDDGSTDGTPQAIQRITDKRVRYLHQANSGASIARNLGVEKSGGSMLAFLDADDLWTSDKLASQVTLLANRPELDMSFGYYADFLSPELAPETSLPRPEIVLPGYSSGTLLIRRDAFLKVGPFSSEWRVGEFIEWYARAVDLGLQYEMLPQLFLRRRIHKSNMGIVKRDARVDYARVVRSIVDRRKQAKE